VVITAAIGLLSNGLFQDSTVFPLDPTSESSRLLSMTTAVTQETAVTQNRHLTIDTAHKSGPRDFFEIASKSGTDKVAGQHALPACLKDRSQCPHPDAVNPQCRVLTGHFYHTMYNKWLGSYSTDDAEPFQFLEIGFYNGNGFDAYKEFLPRAEHHSMEIACIEPGPRDEGKVSTRVLKPAAFTA
jgi:hypothetical protein